jgi:hypothetical protein
MQEYKYSSMVIFLSTNSINYRILIPLNDYISGIFHSL